MKNEIETYLKRIKNKMNKKDVLQTIISMIVILGIFHFITRPKIQYRNVLQKEYTNRIVEVEKKVEAPVKEDADVEYVNEDHLDFGVVFNRYRKQLGAGKVFYWRKSLYTTNYKEEVE